MHYTERRGATAKLGKELRKLGWKLYGWKDDKSDSMTDYYDPESWDGIATKGDFIVCVDASAYMAERSGQEVIRRVPVVGDVCPVCNGFKVDETWSLEAARKNPRQFHIYDHTRKTDPEKIEGTVNDKAMAGVKFKDGGMMTTLFPDVVSPLAFDEGNGFLKCWRCQGRGKLMAKPREEVDFTWPTFQQNPPHKLWHVEKDGKIIASGIGLKGCDIDEWVDDLEAPECRINRKKMIHPGAIALAAKIDGITRNGNGSAEPERQTVTEAEIRINEEKNGVEIVFSGKPGEDVRDKLRANRWRWSRRGGLWYHKDTPEARLFAERIVGDYHG